MHETKPQVHVSNPSSLLPVLVILLGLSLSASVLIAPSDDAWGWALLQGSQFEAYSTEIAALAFLGGLILVIFGFAWRTWLKAKSTSTGFRQSDDHNQ